MTARRDLILILDFGGQYTQLIARRVREQKVYSEIHPFNVPLAKIRELAPRGIILSGGPASCYDPARAEDLERGLRAGRADPRHLLRHAADRADFRRQGDPGRAARVRPRDGARARAASDLFHGFAAGEEIPVWMTHGDRVEALPAGFEIVGESANCPAAAVAAPARKFWGVQFHPEVAHTPRGGEILGELPVPHLRLRAELDDGRLRRRGGRGDRGARSGRTGARSAACRAASTRRWRRRWCCKAMGPRLTCIFVDTGLLRANEAAQVSSRCSATRSRPTCASSTRASASSASWPGVTDPEQKRKIIGREFIAVFEEEAKKVGDARVPRAGDAVPGRDRVGVVQGAVGDDQVAPQRGRPARADAAQARSSRCASCSRTRCARWAPSSACRATCCGASRSPARGWRCACSAR